MCGRKSFLGSIATAEFFPARSHAAGSAICKLWVPARGSCETEVRIDRQREPVIGDACIKSAFEAEPPHNPFNLTRVSAHDRRATVGKDRTSNSCLFTPLQLTRDWSVPDQGAIFFAHHRTSHGRPVADVDVDTAKCRRNILELGYVRQIEETVPSRRHPISRQPARGSNVSPETLRTLLHRLSRIFAMTACVDRE